MELVIMIGKILKYIRKEKKLTQKQLANNLNIAQTTLSGYETKYSNPTFEVIEKIANSCNYEIIFRNKDTNEEVTTSNISRKEL